MDSVQVMKKLKAVSSGPRGLVRVLNNIISVINEMEVRPGKGTTITDTDTGWIITADSDDDDSAGDSGGSSSGIPPGSDQGGPPGSDQGGGGSSGSGTEGGSNDLSYSGDPSDPATWSFNDPEAFGDGLSNVYPNQQDLSGSIDYFVITKYVGSFLTGFATSISVSHDGTVTGTFSALPPGDSNFLITYHFVGGGATNGATSSPFSIPVGGASIILGGTPFFIPN